MYVCMNGSVRMEESDDNIDKREKDEKNPQRTNNRKKKREGNKKTKSEQSLVWTVLVRLRIMVT